MRRILTESDTQLLAEGIYKVLEKLGFYCENIEMLKAYANAGAIVDYETYTAKFPKTTIRHFIEELKAEDKGIWDKWITGHDKMVKNSGYIPYDESKGFKEPYIPYMFHNLSTYYYDDELRERRIGNKPDFIELIKFGDGFHPEMGMGHALNLIKDVEAKIEPIEAALTLLEYSSNPTGVYVHDVEQIKYLEEIEDIFGITDPHFHWMANIPCSSPLKLEKAVADRYVYMLKSGLYPAKLTAMPISGVNIPVTAAGSIVIVAAEFIVLWLAARMIQPKKIPLCGMPIVGTMDIKDGNISFTAFDAVRVRLGICDLIKFMTGIQLAPGPGEWVPTKLPGLYNTMEKAYFAMIAAAYTGYHPDIGVGHLDLGLTISPVQLILETDFTKGLSYLERPLVDEASIGLDTILEIGFGKTENYLSKDHTLEYFKDVAWNPTFFPRGGWSPEIEKDAIDRAILRIKQLKAAYKKPEGREEQLLKAHRVLSRAKEALCKH